ncbi:MAG: L-serine dehydratase [Haloplasmataceae bacterium]|nr:L-serine dehydratase [Haloplasmataceae bacterium]
MDSLKELYKIGFGPSSSHTMGPQRAALRFLEKTQGLAVNKFIVELYGSLAATGVGHLTDWIIKKTLGEDKTEIVFKPDVTYEFHTNGMKFIAFDESGNVVLDYLVFSVGGGTILEENEVRKGAGKIYKLNMMSDILDWCQNSQKKLYEYVEYEDGYDIYNHLSEVWQVMKQCVDVGLQKEDVLPGILNLKRKAKKFYEAYLKDKDITTLMFACSQAVSEQNASGSVVVTAPTCGASGVLPGLLYSLQKVYGYSDEEILRALATGGIIGNLIKENASISGAEAGCQAEVGTACAMASAACAYLFGGNNNQIEYAAEIGLEHHLGLTCDPVEGLVQVPCIERNPIAARRALDAAKYAMLTDGEHVIKLDSVIQTMSETGKDLKDEYRETSKGGLAKIFRIFRRHKGE